ncbi:sigma-70 family RNA polymerase sigma factor [uncultured Paludibaculum sp.]|uniref:RNA polymerase sigma factor n=1 Tax=uncultured Paludibaculum sp. TaxID=1765020 RepID=UPI002AAB9042|nr:sigma-70 family RNA polymerase sigma factor [uncultured Paludibaculum sp.]
MPSSDRGRPGPLFFACKKPPLLPTTLSVGGNSPISTGSDRQDALYRDVVHEFGSSLERLARAYEADPEKRRDLSQDIHFQLWRSFRCYDGRCSLRTWVYRVAHHVAASHVIRERHISSNLATLEELEAIPDKASGLDAAGRRVSLDRLSALVQRLKPLDRQVMVCYLEDMDAASIGEITGLSPGNVAIRIHRSKNVLAKWFHEGKNHA